MLILSSGTLVCSISFNLAHAESLRFKQNEVCEVPLFPKHFVNEYQLFGSLVKMGWLLVNQMFPSALFYETQPVSINGKQVICNLTLAIWCAIFTSKWLNKLTCKTLMSVPIIPQNASTAQKKGGMVNYPLLSKHVSDLVCNGPVHQLLIRYRKDIAKVSALNPCREKLAKV